MIELKDDQLRFRFPEVHADAHVSIDFRRTLRIPDDDNDYPLPPGLGRFPLRHVDDFAARLPDAWKRRGGVTLPMYQSEALWVNLSGSYPFAVKVATGKIDAVTGEHWSDGIHRDPQDYMVVPGQPWLDGYCFEKGIIRQFIAMPLGAGYTVEEQLTGTAEHGGLQVVAYPMKAEVYARILEARRREASRRELLYTDMLMEVVACPRPASPAMGLAPGGRMRQQIYDDPHPFDVWDTRHASRCFVHIANSLTWRAVTGEHPPTPPLTAAEYTRHGLPWFDYYDGDRQALAGADKLAKVRSVRQLGDEKGDVPLPENESVTPGKTVPLRPGGGTTRVREGRF